MEKQEKKKAVKIVGIQLAIITAVVLAVYILYPKTELKVNGTEISFRKINANVIAISENPDFSSPRYIDFEDETINLSLNPGTYYWKASNSYIEGIAQEFTIESEVSMKVDIEDNATKLVNIGNVKLNVTKSKEGMMVGYITLEPTEKEEIVNEGEYLGRQLP